MLIDSEVLGLEVELAALRELGLPCDAERHMARFLGLTGPEWYAEVEKDYVRLHGRELPASFRRTCEQGYRAAMDSDRLVEVEGARSFVAKITVAKAVASSSSSYSLERKLRRTDLWDAFAPHIYSADQVGRGKPEPDLFLHVAASLGADPASCLVIEDRVHGVTAARRAGMFAWGFIGGTHIRHSAGVHLLEAGAERILRSWSEAEGVWFGAEPA